MGSPVNIISNRRQKNWLINGAFSFFQRATSFSITTNVHLYTADRWGFFLGSAGGTTVSQQAHSIYPLGRGRNALRIQRNNGQASTASMQLHNTLETRDAQLLGGKKLTFSFTAHRGANFSPTGNILNASILHTSLNPDTNYITGWSSPVTTANLAVALTTTPTRYSVTATVPSGVVGVAVNFLHVPTGTAGVNDWYQIEDIQLEVSPAATEFEMRGISVGPELQFCQRYFEKTYPLDRFPGSVGVGNDGVLTARWPSAPPTNNELIATWRFAVPKRVVPSMTWYNPETGTIGEWRQDAPGNASAITHAGGTSQFGSAVSNGGATNTAFHRVHGTAEAEL